MEENSRRSDNVLTVTISYRNATKLWQKAVNAEKPNTNFLQHGNQSTVHDILECIINRRNSWTIGTGANTWGWRSSSLSEQINKNAHCTVPTVDPHHTSSG